MMMQIFKKLYQKIAEPRVYRLLQLTIYVILFIAGVCVNIWPPLSLVSIIGQWYLYIMAWSLIIGSLFAGVAILPGIWWLERTGLLLMATSMAIYLIIVASLGSSVLGVCVSSAFIIQFAQRWFEIRKWMLEPKIKKG